MGIFKRYWDKFKYNKKRRDYMIKLFDNADIQVELYLGDEYVNWRDEIDGARDFLKEIDSQAVEKRQVKKRVVKGPLA